MKKEEKLAIIKSLIWDYNYTPEEVLKKEESDAIFRNWLFVRSFEHLPWQKVLNFWGLDTCLNMGNQKIRNMIRPQLRGKYDRIYKLLRNEPVSPSEWDLESYRKIISPLLSNRWYSIK